MDITNLSLEDKSDIEFYYDHLLTLLNIYNLKKCVTISVYIIYRDYVLQFNEDHKFYIEIDLTHETDEKILNAFYKLNHLIN